ncbi:KICSTOR complex protein kaptin [Phytophthora citrophthora]|uniref:KICSTOR complex protein kaptin n=1 Tax=Phytophthora citrophthora TaxID=4793 RepID=A0AAD9LCC7_9STRA|nr:KICSTOR complex protein kaptin [Phytophthora citrophthora]
MAMRFHQRRFFVYPSGVPNLHTLSSVRKYLELCLTKYRLLCLNVHHIIWTRMNSYTLVTTDRCVSLLGYGEAGYSLHKLEAVALRTGKAIVVASAAIERPVTRQTRVAVAYAVGDDLFLQVWAPNHESPGNGEAADASDCGKFELEAAPTCMFSVHAKGTNGDEFYGVMVCCSDTMMAFGYTENGKDGATAACGRLDNEHFAGFFPEFGTFSHTILAVDIFTSPEKDQGWIAFGCADGLVRVFNGQVHDGCLGGPFKIKDLQLNGPVTSVALFPKQHAAAEGASSTWHCNLLVTCAIGQAVVYEDLYSTSDEGRDGEMLMDSDSFDSIFAGVTADVDLDGKVELLLGTDSQVMLAYKEATDHEEAIKSVHESRAEESTGGNEDTASPTAPDSSPNIWSDLDTIPVEDEDVHSVPKSSMVQRRKWQKLSRSHWDLETFGAIYSLLWRDINHDGVPELLIASSTGIYVYEADPVLVIDKLQGVLEALHTSSTAH